MKQTAWALIYGVDGFGADIAPALEEGIFLNRETALEHCIQLNLEQFKKNDINLYDKGWGEDYYDEESEDGKILLALEDKDDYQNPLWDEIFDKHTIKDTREKAKMLALRKEPLHNFYCIQETFVR